MKKTRIFTLCILLALSACVDKEVELLQSEVLKSEYTTALKETDLARRRPPLQLIHAWSSFDLYNSSPIYTRRFTVKLADFAFEKGVRILHRLLDGNVEEFPLYYIGKAEDGFEIWEARVTSSEAYYADKFIVKYETEGVTYYDNNNGQQYSLKANDGAYLAPDINILRDRAYSYISGKGLFVVGVDIRNLAYEKQVSIVYTTDNWQTVQEKALTHSDRFYFGISQYVPSPNVNNIERWSGSVRFEGPAPNFQYALRYRVNGQEYWDNNYGRNFGPY